jgi:DNA-binding phage protein
MGWAGGMSQFAFLAPESPEEETAKLGHRRRQGAVGGLQGAQERASEMSEDIMPLTRSFKEFVKSRIERDPKFRQALFQEAVQMLIEGDVDTAKSVLRDYINATIGFPALAEATRMPPKSLMRMFGPKGNPTAVNLFGVIVALQDKTGVHLEVRAVAA